MVRLRPSQLPIRTVAAALAIVTTLLLAGQEAPGRAAFLDWAGRTAVRLSKPPAQLQPADFAPLGKLIGTASIVALSEAVHVGAEPLEFRNRLVEYGPSAACRRTSSWRGGSGGTTTMPATRGRSSFTGSTCLAAPVTPSPVAGSPPLSTLPSPTSTRWIQQRRAISSPDSRDTRWSIPRPRRTKGINGAIVTRSAPVRSTPGNMAANLEWILGREGPDAKILIYASRYHISASPARQARDSLGNQVLGVFLRHRYGARMVNIGNLINKGGWGCHRSNALTPATAASLDGTVATLGQTNLILDLRSAPRGWLDRVIPLGSDGFIELRPAEAFDLLWYIDSVRPACA